MTQKEKLEKLRHTAAHVLADAVEEMYPGVKLGIGPATEDGFYYDFDFRKLGADEKSSFLREEDLKKIEQKMRQIVEADQKLEKRTVSIEEARQIFEDQPYKLELLDGLEDENVSVYSHGKFKDLCKGPHLNSTKDVKAFKLLSLAGAYWKGNESNPMLQRVYGTAFFDNKSLRKHLNFLEEAKKRDHRLLGRELDLFSFDERAGAGLVIYHPKGALLRQIIIDYITAKHLEKGYKLISSPHILKSDVWIQSGHYEHYKENMYILEKDGQEYAVKPMNCPGHIMVYTSRLRSFRELPLRFFELGSVYRHEKSGTLHGLLRVRAFTQDDAHIFCLPSQATGEVKRVIDFVEETLEVFGFTGFEVDLATKPEKYIGSDDIWTLATSALEKALQEKNVEYNLEEGDGAFYGPKIDIKIKDAIGRSWQCATIQCDLALPERFDMTYIDSDGRKKRPIVLHRVILGSLERFIGTLIEHYAGELPLWLSPEQVRIIPIATEHVDFAKKTGQRLAEASLRAETDDRNEKMQKKIREAELEKVPYMAVVGSKEMQNGTVSVRSKKDGRLGVLTIEEFIERLKEEEKRKQ